jgi:hypothetical protein
MADPVRGRYVARDHRVPRVPGELAEHPGGSSPPRLRPRPTTTSASTSSCGTYATTRRGPRARRASPRWPLPLRASRVCRTRVDLDRLSLCGLDDARFRPLPRTLEPDDELTIAAGELPLRPGHAALECGRDRACAGRHAPDRDRGLGPPLLQRQPQHLRPEVRSELPPERNLPPAGTTRADSTPSR